MGNALSIFFVFLSLLRASQATIDVEFETRVNLSELSQKHEDLSRSIAAMIPKKWFIKTKIKDKYLLTYKNLKSEKNFCNGEKFLEQPSIAKCTGSLISDTRILTAGHCLDQADLQKSCDDYFWVFDYKKDFFSQTAAFPGKAETLYSKNLLTLGKEIFECQTVLSSSYSKNKLDFAVLKLKQKPNRKEIIIERDDKASVSQVSLGFPNGVPMMGNRGALYLSKKRNLAYNNMYAPIGSSGSPVFNREGSFLGMIISSTYEQVSDGECLSESTFENKVPLTLYKKSSLIHKLLN